MRMRYCIVPGDIAHVAPLVEAAWEGGEVIVERRADDRRSGLDRRARSEGPLEEIYPPADMRHMPLPDGRRVGERRSVTIPTPAPELDLPRRARRHAARLQWVEVLPLADQVREDQEVARQLLRAQAGDPAALHGIYEAYVDRAYRYLQLALGDGEEAEVALGRLFSRAFDAALTMDPRPGAFRRWLGRELREESLRHADPSLIVDELEDPERDAERDTAHEEQVLNWVGDQDVAFFVGRLPSPHREVLLLRDVVGLELQEIAGLVSRTPAGAGRLYGRGLALLGEHLSALDRSEIGTRQRLHMRSARRPNRVLTGRRRALAGFGA